MIKIGTIGTSAICSHFLDGMDLTEKFKLSAVYSRSIETGRAFAKSRGCEKVFTDLSEMAVWDGIDAVYIASPNSLHYEQSKLFLENKKHVLCEKPITTNSDEYIRLKKLADTNGCIYMEAIMPIHTKKYSEVKKALQSIGKILSARIDFSQRSSRLDKFLSGEKVNIFDMSLHAGTLMDLGVYCVYGAIDLLGEPKKITATANYLYNGADGSGAALFKYDDFTAILTYNKVCQGVIGSEIIGENGTLQISSISQYAGVILIKDGKKEVIVDFPKKAEIMSGEAEKFANYILSFDEFIDDYKKVSHTCLCVHKSMDEIKKSANIKYI